MKSKSLLSLSTIMLIIFSLTLTSTVTASSTTKIYVNPPLSGKEISQVGQEFSVTIDVANVEFLYAWKFSLEWNPDLLEVPDDPATPGTIEGFSEGSFLNQEKSLETRLTAKPGLGKLTATCTLIGVASGDAPSGSGTLATVTFLAKAEGGCPLHLSDTRLTKFEGAIPQPVSIPHTSEDGYFKYPLPKLYVEPLSIMDSTLVPGSNFTVDIKAVGIGEGQEKERFLKAWEFFFSWDPNLLDATNIVEGSFLNQNGTQPTDFLSEIDQTEGYVHANCTLVGSVLGASGDGTIVTVTFQVEAAGETSLNLDKTKLVDIENAPIIHTAQDGYFHNEICDIVITKVEAFPTKVKAGDYVTINVTVKNRSIATETLIDISVTTPSPPSTTYVLIGTKAISSLSPDQEINLMFSWNTKKVVKGEYTIRAQASFAPGETDTENNALDIEDAILVTTSPKQLSTLLIIGAIIVVAIIATAMLLYNKKSLQKLDRHPLFQCSQQYSWFAQNARTIIFGTHQKVVCAFTCARATCSASENLKY